MNTLKKMNRGALLASFIVVGVIIFVIASAAYEDAQKPELEASFAKIIEYTAKSLVVPEEFRDGKKTMTYGEALAFVSGVWDGDAGKLCADEGYMESLAEKLLEYAENNYIISEFTVQENAYTYDMFNNESEAQTGYSFKNGRAEVSAGFTIKYTVSGSLKNNDVYNTVIFEKKGGTWKAVEYSVGTPLRNAGSWDYNDMYGFGNMMYGY